MSLSQRSARNSGSRLSAAISLPAAGDDSGLRTAEELIAAEADEIHTLTQHLGGRRLVLEPGDRLRV